MEAEATLVSVNFEDLLKKYIHHVTEMEGINFIDSCPTDPMYESLGYTMFTRQEVELLKVLSSKE